MKDPKVVYPEGFDVVAAWGSCSDWVESHGAGSLAAAFGADPGCCECPVCKQDYWAWGEVIECDCGFVFPTRWWSDYSSGVNDGRRLATGGTLSKFMDLRCRNPYYREGLERSVEEAWQNKDTLDWKTIAAKASVEDLLPISTTNICGRCGKEKEQSRSSSPSKLCMQCTTETECKYRCSMMENQCRAGVVFDELRGDNSRIGYSLPCYFIGGTQRIACDKFDPVTIDDCVESDQRIENAIARMMAAMPLVARIKDEHKGKDWSGVNDCPICQGSLHMTHSGYNGHVHGKCETEDCLSWVE